jgi:hypothetical protein
MYEYYDYDELKLLIIKIIVKISGITFYFIIILLNFSLFFNSRVFTYIYLQTSELTDKFNFVREVFFWFSHGINRSFYRCLHPVAYIAIINLF